MNFILIDFFLSLPSPQTVALARPGVEPNQPSQRIMTNSISITSVSPAPLSAPNSTPAPHTGGSLRPLGSNINPSTQSKLTGTNGIPAVKIGGFGQNTVMQSSQETSQDKQVEQAKLVSFLSTCCLLLVLASDFKVLLEMGRFPPNMIITPTKCALLIGQ